VLLSKIKFLLLHMRFAFTIVSLSVIALNLSAQTNTQNLPKPAAQTAAQSVSLLKDVAVPAKIDTLISAYAALNQFNGTILVTQGANTIFRKVYGFRMQRRRSSWVQMICFSWVRLPKALHPF